MPWKEGWFSPFYLTGRYSVLGTTETRMDTMPHTMWNLLITGLSLIIFFQGSDTECECLSRPKLQTQKISWPSITEIWMQTSPHIHDLEEKNAAQGPVLPYPSSVLGTKQEENYFLCGFNTFRQLLILQLGGYCIRFVMCVLFCLL